MSNPTLVLCQAKNGNGSRHIDARRVRDAEGLREIYEGTHAIQPGRLYARPRIELRSELGGLRLLVLLDLRRGNTLRGSFERFLNVHRLLRDHLRGGAHGTRRHLHGSSLDLRILGYARSESLHRRRQILERFLKLGGRFEFNRVCGRPLRLGPGLVPGLLRAGRGSRGQSHNEHKKQRDAFHQWNRK